MFTICTECGYGRNLNLLYFAFEATNSKGISYNITTYKSYNKKSNNSNGYSNNREQKMTMILTNMNDYWWIYIYNMLMYRQLVRLSVRILDE